MKKIVVMPIKNEEWILEKSLACASLWADHIVVADQHSTDSSADICKQFDKVVYVVNDLQALNQSAARQLLLDKTRELFGPDNIICALDADEILTSNSLSDPELEAMLTSLNPGQSIVLQWVMLWGSPDRYRNDDSIWGNNWKHFIFRDDGRSVFSDKITSEPRMPEAIMNNSVRCSAVKVLHYQFVNWKRMLAKQRRYRVYDFLKKPNFLNAIKINNLYLSTRDVEKEQVFLSSVPEEWISQYEGIDLQNFPDERIYWYEIDVLRQFAQAGERYFKWLDIWDVDWDNLRDLAIAGGITDMSNRSVEDPRGLLIRTYHKYEKVIHKFLKGVLSVIS